MLWAPAAEENHLGRGVSKQAARSFQRLLRRTAPVEAQETLVRLLTAEPLSETRHAMSGVSLSFLGMMCLLMFMCGGHVFGLVGDFMRIDLALFTHVCT